MRFTTDENTFGFLLSPQMQSGMYRFQLIIDGQLVGQDGACFVESAMEAFGDLNHLNDDRLSRLEGDATSILALLDADDAMHDAALLGVAESFDGWKVRGYEHDGRAVILAQRRSTGQDGAREPTLLASIPLDGYAAVYGAVQHYWAKTRVTGNL